MIDEGEIQERFIRAAKIDARGHEHVGPRPLRAQSLAYVHDFADKAGWGTKRLEEERQEFWDRVDSLPSAREISEADETRSWVRFVGRDKDRAALLAWADSKAGAGVFKLWCFARGIHPNTGRKQKDRAISQIACALGSKVLQNNEKGEHAGLLEDPETAYLRDTVKHRVHRQGGLSSWSDDTAFSSIERPEFRDFSWAEKRNEMRRRKDARKRKEREAA